jgi:hypothetical protein
MHYHFHSDYSYFFTFSVNNSTNSTMGLVHDTKEARAFMRTRLRVLVSAKKCWIFSGVYVSTVAGCIILMILLKNKQAITDTKGTHEVNSSDVLVSTMYSKSCRSGDVSVHGVSEFAHRTVSGEIVEPSRGHFDHHKDTSDVVGHNNNNNSWWYHQTNDNEKH